MYRESSTGHSKTHLTPTPVFPLSAGPGVKSFHLSTECINPNLQHMVQCATLVQVLAALGKSNRAQRVHQFTPQTSLCRTNALRADWLVRGANGNVHTYGVTTHDQ